MEKSTSPPTVKPKIIKYDKVVSKLDKKRQEKEKADALKKIELNKNKFDLILRRVLGRDIEKLITKAMLNNETMITIFRERFCMEKEDIQLVTERQFDFDKSIVEMIKDQLDENFEVSVNYSMSGGFTITIHWGIMGKINNFFFG